MMQLCPCMMLRRSIQFASRTPCHMPDFGIGQYISRATDLRYERSKWWILKSIISAEIYPVHSWHFCRPQWLKATISTWGQALWVWHVIDQKKREDGTAPVLHCTLWIWTKPQMTEVLCFICVGRLPSSACSWSRAIYTCYKVLWAQFIYLSSLWNKILWAIWCYIQ